jgi:beta-glucanase (GH16 family)
MTFDGAKLEVICDLGEGCDNVRLFNPGYNQAFNFTGTKWSRSFYNYKPGDKVSFYVVARKNNQEVNNVGQNFEWIVPNVKQKEAYEETKPVKNYPGFTIVTNDEFNTFNSNFWQARNDSFDENGAQFVDDCVGVKDGKLNLTIYKQKYSDTKDFIAGQIDSKDFNRRYGRYEIRLKCPKGTGYAATMFTFNTSYTNGKWEELDLEVEGQYTDRIMSNNIFGENNLDGRIFDKYNQRTFGECNEDGTSGFSTLDWNVYAIEWTPDKVDYLINDKVVKSVKADIPSHCAQVMLNFWLPMNKPPQAFGGDISGNTYPMTASYDYFRYYKWDGDTEYPK